MTSGIQTFILAQSEGGAGDTIVLLILLGVILLTIMGMWKVFAKAGQPGWAVIIPIYNIIVLLEVAKRPLWWLILMFVPIVSMIVAIVVALDVARNFGKGAGYGLGLAFLPFIFYPMLGFGDDQYQA